LRTTSKSSSLVLSFFVILFAVIFSSGLKAAYVISSLYVQPSPAATVSKIGDTLNFNMSVINATATYNDISISSSTANNITFSSPTFPAVFPGGIYIYDGTHTWLDTAGYTAPQQLTIDNTMLIAGPAVSNYSIIQLLSGAVGTPGSGGTATVSIGTAISGIPLTDGGNGIYNTAFLIRENYQFNIQNGQITGNFIDGTASASNAPFTAPTTINIDGIRPTIQLVNVNPNPYNPNKGLAQFFYYMSENSTVTLTITQGAVTIKSLTATGNFGYNNPILWDGLDNNANEVVDGNYTFTFNYTDMAGNTGVPYSANLIVTTVELDATLAAVNTQFAHTPEAETVVTINMGVNMINASKANLANLGFNYTAGETGATHDFHNYPYIYIDLRLYNSVGTEIFVAPRDSFPTTDTDYYYTNPNYGNKFADLKPFSGFLDGGGVITYNPVPTDPCSIIPADIYTIPDGILTNDWDIVFAPVNNFVDNNNGTFTAQPSYTYYSTSISAGTYIVSFRSILVGRMIDVVGTPATASEVCGTNTINYTQAMLHAQPSYFNDSFIGDNRGYGLTSNQTTVSFVVPQDVTVPLPDNLPPVIVASSAYPSNNQVLNPGVINSTNYIKVTLQDNGVGAGPTNLSTIALYDPYGNPVGGHVAWNGGTPGTKTWEIYYIPDKPITVGGVYTYQVTPVDASDNIGPTVTFTFTIVDQSIPTVSNVNVGSISGSTQMLQQSASTQVGFLVTTVNATLLQSSTAAVDWANSGIMVSGTAGVIAGSLTHTAGTNILSFIPSSTISDGQYTAYVTAATVNGFQGAYSYQFNISTAGVTYVDITGTGENTTTYLRLSSYVAGTSGITDSNNAAVPAADLEAALIPSPPATPGTYVILGNCVSFTAAPFVLPLSFNANQCSTTLRMHYSAANVATLTSLGLTPLSLTLWMWNGASWSQVSGLSAPVSNGTDNYYEVQMAAIPLSNAFALMYAPPSVQLAAFHFLNTKAFNPTAGPAKYYYTSDITTIKDVKVYIYNISGSVVRTLVFSDAADHPLFTGSDANPTSPANVMYYVSWDGKNGAGAYVRNGLYLMKIVTTNTGGGTSSASRMIAVVK
jgi:flagellar hook assembly protein FlgD